MKKSKEDYFKKLAAVIFPGTGIADLDDHQREFVHLHVKLYKSFKKKVAKLFRSVIARNIYAQEIYTKIFQLYKDRASFEVIQEGVNTATQEAERTSKVIYAVGFFDCHINHFHKKDKKFRIEYITELFGEEPADMWHYQLWLEYREGKEKFVFCPILGVTKTNDHDDDGWESDSEEIDEKVYADSICAPKVDGRLIELRKKLERKEQALLKLHEDMPFIRQRIPGAISRYQDTIDNTAEEIDAIRLKISQIEGNEVIEQHE